MVARDARPASARQRRVLRGAAASAIPVLLAAVSHSYGGGTPPGFWLVLAATLLAWPVATLLASTRLGLAGLGIASVVAQSLLHIAFAITDGAAPVTGGGHHHAMLVLGDAGTAALSLPDGRMLTAHVIAAALAFAVLGFGRRALGVLARGVRLALRRLAAAPLGPISVPRPAPAAQPRVGSAFWRTVLRRRGPPVVSPLPAS